MVSNLDLHKGGQKKTRMPADSPSGGLRIRTVAHHLPQVQDHIDDCAVPPVAQLG